VSRFVTAAGILVTFVAWTGTVLDERAFVTVAIRQRDALALAGAVVYLILVSVLIYGSLVYLFSRWGYLTRLAGHGRASEIELNAFRQRGVPAVTVLVPSYKEDAGVVRKTLLSAALQDYPRRSVVLLLDDPPMPATPQDARALDEMRLMPEEIEEFLAPMRARTARALAEFEAAETVTSTAPVALGARRLGELLRETGEWFAEQARRWDVRDHSDRLFVELTFVAEGQKLQRDAEVLAAKIDTGRVDARTLHAGYRRLAERFAVSVRAFERKRYANLSHEPNKAMNLNSYLGLMGGSFQEHREDGRLVLRPAPPGAPGIAIPDSEFVLLLDADSILHPEYAVRLAHRLQEPDHERVAVIQTPYSAFPGADGGLERIAGATTDIQYQIHQGFTHYHATFWVGANAMARMRALREIAEARQEPGGPVRIFIQDRTVIEDTESTVDLRQREWQLQNYPERLAFSATPPDFGSLLIQRRRWANGGLLIVPKLWRCAWKNWGRWMTVGEASFRLHYLTSLAASNVALLVLLAWGFDERLASFWLPISAVPYYVLYAADLRRAGYLRRDVLGVYALNMLLVPVSLGGVLGSIRQICTGRRSPFGRTPKIIERTAVPAGYVAAEIALLVSWMFGAVIELYEGHRLNAALGLANATVLLYALVRFVGVRPACQDLAPLAQALRRPWAMVRATLIPRARRLATPAMVVLGLLLLPAAATGAEVAITVDDLPAHGPLPRGSDLVTRVDAVIAALKRHGVVGAVGFVNGDQLSVSPDHTAVLGRWVAAGYPLGNHTFSHVDLHRSDVPSYLTDVARNEEALAPYAPPDAPRLFRYPYLHEGNVVDTRRAVRAALHGRGYEITPVTIDVFDWAWNDAYVRCVATGQARAIGMLQQKFLRDADRALDWSERSARLLIGRSIKHVLLLHLGAFDALMLDDLLTMYERRGVRFVSVAEALTDPIYGIDPGMTGGTNFLLQLLRATGRRPAPRPPHPSPAAETMCRRVLFADRADILR
jgi:cellulose synthase (UDP-forming)